MLAEAEKIVRKREYHLNYNREWRAKNPDKVREYRRVAYRKSSEKKLEQNKRWRTENPEKARAAQQKWKKQNPEKNAEYLRKWRKEHIEEERERGREYSAANRTMLADKSRKYRISNSEKASAAVSKWAKEYPEKIRANSQRRRSRKRGLESTLTAAEWQKILDDHFHRCHYCGVKSDALHQEHKIPVVEGGGYTADNIVPACKGCNSSKGAKSYRSFREQCKNRLQAELF